MSETVAFWLGWAIGVPTALVWSAAIRLIRQERERAALDGRESREAGA